MPKIPSFSRGMCFASEALRVAPRRIALVALALTTPAIPSSLAAPTSLPDDTSDLTPPSVSRNLAVFDDPGALSTHFIEHGAAQFSSVTRDGLVWAPTATNVYTLILARRSSPRVVADKTVITAFRLPTDGASFGIHLHGKSESAPSHLVLVSRTASDRGLIRVYRTPTWPSGTIPVTDLLPSAQARVPAFPANTWYRLVVTTQTNLATAETTLSILLLSDRDGAVITTLDAHDPGPALPGAGLISLRLFAPSGGRVDVRSLIGQPRP